MVLVVSFIAGFVVAELFLTLVLKRNTIARGTGGFIHRFFAGILRIDGD